MSGDIVAPLQGVDTSSLSPLGITTAAANTSLSKDGECFFGGDELGVDVIGLVAIIIFYLAVLGVSLKRKICLLRIKHSSLKYFDNNIV